jgi:Arc/MetJ-type ribon-helix-helix transcriptional regulator
MSKPKLIVKTEKASRKSEQLNISISPYIKQQLEALVEQRLFSNVSDAVRYAITKMITEFETQGRLKPKKPPEMAEERVKNATYTGSKEVEVD